MYNSLNNGKRNTTRDSFRNCEEKSVMVVLDYLTSTQNGKLEKTGKHRKSKIQNEFLLTQNKTLKIVQFASFIWIPDPINIKHTDAS